MSRIFRSDAVRVGDRVVVRQRRGEHASDIVGHVIGLDPLVVRPQEVGGFPSSKEAIEVADVHIIKKLSPRTVRNSEIRDVERRLADALDVRETAWAGGWLMRTGAGEEANSAAPLGPSAGFEPLPLDAIRTFYAERGLPVRLTVPERIGKPALKLIDDAWTLGPEQVAWTSGDAVGAALVGEVPAGAAEHHRRRAATLNRLG